MSNNLVTKLLTVQKELKAPKGQFNNFGKYKYRSAEDILEALKPLNTEYGLLLTLTDEPVMIGDWHYIKATASITDGEQTQEVTAYARESQDKKGMDSMQITGTASSYARKYALNGLYLIDDTKDADTDEYQNQNKQQDNQQKNQSSNNQPKKASEPQLNKINVLLDQNAKAHDKKKEEIYAGLKEKMEKEMENFTSQEASKAIKLLESWVKKAEEEKQKAGA